MPPAVIVQPQSLAVSAGANTSLGVSVGGTQPLSFQWRLNGTNLPNAETMAGVTNPTLTLLNVQAANAGNYSVVVTNSVGSVTSLLASLTVSGSKPSFAVQPQGQTIAVHGSIQMNGLALGSSPIAYQWRRNGTNLFDGDKLAGASAAILSAYDLGATDSGNYTLVASNAYGSATSAVAVVSVVLPPSIVQQPQSQGIKVGGAFSALVQATGGTPLTYQWRLNGANLANSGRITGVATTNLAITSLVPGDAGNYDVMVTNPSGTTNSAVAVLAVLVPPALTAQPQNVATNLGATAMFSVGVSGASPLAFQWQFNGTNLANSASVIGATSNVLTLLNLQPSAVGYYSVRVTNSVGLTNSSIATLSLFADQNYVFANTNRILVNDNAKATPYPSTLSVSNVAGTVRRVSVTLSNVTHSYPADMQVLLVGPLGQRILLLSDAGATMAPNQTFTFADSATGLLSQYGQLVSGTYRPTDWPPVSVFPTPAPAAPYGNLLSVLTNQNPNGVWSLYVFDAAAGDDGFIAGGWALSVEATVNQMQAPLITVGPQSQARIAGETALFTVSVTGTQPFTYRWRRNGTNLSDGLRINGSGTAALTLTNLQRADAGSFSVMVSNLVSAVTSAPPAILTVAAIGFDASVRLSDGTIQLNMHGELGTLFEIQNSADLRTWKRLTVFTNTTGFFQFTDPGSASSARRFYRVVTQ